MRPRKKTVVFYGRKNELLRNKTRLSRVNLGQGSWAVRRRLSLLAAVCLSLLIVAIAQYDSNPPPGPATTEVSPPAADESQPTSIVTPGAETDAAGEPLAPRPSAAESEAGPTLQPGSEAVTEEVAAPTIVPEETRKRWRLTPILAVGVLHDDNIFLSNTNRVADVIWTFSTGLSFELGDFREGKENYLNLFWVGLPVISPITQSKMLLTRVPLFSPNIGGIGSPEELRAISIPPKGQTERSTRLLLRPPCPILCAFSTTIVKKRASI